MTTTWSKVRHGTAASRADGPWVASTAAATARICWPAARSCAGTLRHTRAIGTHETSVDLPTFRAAQFVNASPRGHSTASTGNPRR
jgi:hypothetical protein